MATIVIMPGGFHPFHAGHYALYRSAVEAFPDADVYVAATADTSTRPFPFPVKEKLAKLAGVPANRFVQVRSPFKAEEITTRYNPLEDTLIFVRSEKDRTSPPKPGGTKRDGSPSYLQPYTGKDMEPFAKHAYMAYLPTVEFGPGITSASEIRAAWPKLDDRRKTAMVMSLYPKTQTNPKLAQTVVKLLDAAIGGQDLAEGLEYADKLSGLVDLPVFNSSTNPNPSGVAKVVNTGDRIMVVMNVRGVNVPYYISTGQGGKASVPTGKWYPVFGVHSSGWLNKGGEDSINKFYGSKMLALNAGRLNNALGDLSSVEAQIPFMKKTGFAIINKDLQPMGHSEVSANPNAFKERVNSFLAKLGEGPYYTIDKPKEPGVAEGAPIVVAQAPIDVRNPKKQQSRQEKPLTAYQQGVASQGKPYKNPYPFDPKAGADVNYDHNQYRAGYKKQGVTEASYMSLDDYKNNLQKALPSIIEYYQDELGFTPSKEQLASAVKAAHATMEKTGDTEQAGESLEAVLDSFVPSNSSNKNLPKIDFKKNLLQVLQQKYPDAEFKITPDRVESTDGQLSVIADTAQEGRYVGCFMWDVSTGPYKGALGLAIKQTTDQLLQANPGKKPALFISGDNQNPKAWSYIAKKLKYKLITDENELEEGSLNEFAVDGFGDNGDHRSKLLASVGRLFDAGNKVDWQVPGQMGHVTRVQDDGITMKKWKKPHSRMSFFLPMTDDSRDKNYTIKMVGPKHYAVVSAEQDVEENQGWAATYEEVRGAPSGAGAGMTAGYQRRENQPIAEKQRPEIERDPELKQARLFAKQHYPEFSGDEELAYDKWVQRSIQHGLEDDQKQFKLLQGVAEKIKRLERTIAVVKQQRQQQTNEDYIDEKWSKKYKSSINCANPRGFSQRAHCAGRKK